jgi:hypothetical protein
MRCGVDIPARVLGDERSCFGPKGSERSGEVVPAQNVPRLKTSRAEWLFVGVFNLPPRSVVVWRCPHDLPVIEAVQVNGRRLILGGNAMLTADWIQIVVL